MQLKSIFRLIILSLGPMLLALALSWLPTPPPVQAIAQQPLPAAQMQSRAAITVYLPIIRRSPTPEEELLALINAERQRRGLGALTFNVTLMQVAEAHSQDMVDRDFFSHTNPDDDDPGDRLNDAGYFGAWGETIGAGSIYASPEGMFGGWMGSSGHQEIMLSDNFNIVGLGYVTGGAYGHYWTAVFGHQ
jgi:uncharacterized protein YkwD